MYEAEIRIRYRSSALARSIKRALVPDDKSSTSRMAVSTEARGRVLLVQVRRCEKIETLQATVQDIFRCIHATESSLGKIATRDQARASMMNALNKPRSVRG